MIVHSGDEMVARAQAFLGQSRQDPGCPWSKAPNVDDCAKFASFVGYGANAKGEGPVAWVDTIKTLGIYHAGKAGMQRGDYVLFDWDGNGVGNHVEIATIAPNAKTGQFLTIGANGSDTIKVGFRNRNTYVMGYVRPAYGASTVPASTVSKPVVNTPTPAPTQEEDIMASLADLNNALAPVVAKLDQLIKGPAEQAAYAKAIDDQYLDVLGRHADQGGLSMFLGLMTGGWTEDQVRQALIASDEYAGRWIGNVYQADLGRAASADEVNGWVTWKNANGKTLPDVQTEIRNSAEYKGKH